VPPSVLITSGETRATIGPRGDPRRGTREAGYLVNEQQISEAVASIIEALGEDAGREGLRETPRRVAKLYAEFFSGLGKDPAAELATGFEEDHHEMVVIKDIQFYSVCEHHLLPFYGAADIGYVPRGKVVGASKLARAMDVLAHRPQLQERLTTQLADVVYSTLQPEGVAVILRAEHMCMTLRGVKKLGSSVVTTASRGSLKTQASVRQEFLAMTREN
jgi:GTP cyclohydrolase I